VVSTATGAAGFAELRAKLPQLLDLTPVLALLCGSSFGFLRFMTTLLSV
jgi:hypothetical protein